MMHIHFEINKLTNTNKRLKYSPELQSHIQQLTEQH